MRSDSILSQLKIKFLIIIILSFEECIVVRRIRRYDIRSIRSTLTLYSFTDDFILLLSSLRSHRCLCNDTPIAYMPRANTPSAFGREKWSATWRRVFRDIHTQTHTTRTHVHNESNEVHKATQHQTNGKRVLRSIAPPPPFPTRVLYERTRYWSKGSRAHIQQTRACDERTKF